MRKALFIGCAAVLLLGCVWTAAQPAPGGPGGAGPGMRGGMVSGFVTAVGADSITVRAWGSTDTVTVTVMSDTPISRARTLKPSDLKVGDEVRAMGRRVGDQEDSPIEATMVMVGAGGPGGGPGGPGGPGGRGFGGFGAAVGKIKSASANQIVVTTDSGDRTVRLTESTQIQRTDRIALRDIKVGDWVTAMGQREDSTVSAGMVRVSEPPSNLNLFGLVTSKDANSIEVQPRFSNVKTKVTVPASASVLRAERAEIGDVKVGDKVTVIARTSTADQGTAPELTAVAILFGEPLPQGILTGGGLGGMTFGGTRGTRGGGAGGAGVGAPGGQARAGAGGPGGPGAFGRQRTFTAEVTSVSPFTVKDGDTTRTLRVSGQTVIRKLVKATLDSAKTDEAVAVFGKPTAGGFEARLVVFGLTQNDLGRLGTGAGGPGGAPMPPAPPGT